LLTAIGVSVLSGMFVVSIKNIKKKSLKRRLMDVMLACKIVTSTNKTVLYPIIVDKDKKPYGFRFVVRLPDGYPSDVVLDKWWIPMQEALGKEIQLDFDKFLYIDIFNGTTPKEIEWREDFI
jgi:hypothetical protein